MSLRFGETDTVTLAYYSHFQKMVSDHGWVG